jgi:ABC-type Zn2+ transport system substrate-binding protein/surface adhesin
MKQTAVEFLYEAIENELIDFLESRIDVNELSKSMLKAKQEALEMEKKQIVETMNVGFSQGFAIEYKDAEQYYNETYGKEETK